MPGAMVAALLMSRPPTPNSNTEGVTLMTRFTGVGFVLVSHL
jgi:hypothetical protein